MKRNGIVIWTAALAMLIFTWSCDAYLDQFSTDNISNEVEINPSLAAPVAYGNFSLQDVLEAIGDSLAFVEVDEDSLIHIIYSDTAISLDAEALLDLPVFFSTETYINTDVDKPEWQLLPVGSQMTFYKQESIEFGIDGNDRLDSILIKSGNLSLQAFSKFKHMGELRITSSNIINPAGDTLDRTFIISTTAGTYDETENFDLSNYKLTMTNEGDSLVAVLHFTLTLTKSPEPVLAGEDAGVICSFEDLKYDALYGFISEREITSINESIDLGLFGSIEEIPEIYFEDPRLKIIIDNSFGIPVRFKIDTLGARSVDDGSYTYLTFKDPSLNPFLIAAPTVQQAGEFVTSTINLNVETCNIDELISVVPDRLDINFDASTGNPPGSTEQNFVLDDSKLRIIVEADLPMWLSTSGYVLEDTLDFEIDNLLEDLFFLDAATFRLTTTNEWPLEISMQIYFLDGLDQRIDSLFSGQTALLEAAPVNATGEINRDALEENVVEVVLLEEDLEKLKGAKKMLLRARAVTTENGAPTVKFYSTYKLNYKLGIDADFTFNSRELDIE